MNKSIWGIALGSALLAGVFAVRADEVPATQPAGKHATSRPAAQIRINKPYNELTGLTEEQRTKISELEKKNAAARTALEKQEEEDIRALLTDDQKAELDKMAAEKKGKMAERNKEKKEPAKKDGAAPAAPAAGN